MKKLIKFAKTSGTATAITMILLHGASAQTLSQAPLEATITVEPNVMLFLDDSLSMNNLTTADGYDSVTAYTQWVIPYTAGFTAGAFYPNNIPRGNILQGTCPNAPTGTNHYIEGTFNGETRCIRIPDPNTGTSLNDTLNTENYLRYLFDTYTSAATPNVDLTGGIIPTETRVEVLRNAAASLVNGSNDIRWCLADLLNSGTDTIPLSACGQDPLPAIAALDLDGGGTPLAETMFEIVKYFEEPYTGTAGGGPVEYRCQKNFTVIITDGYPTNDSSDSAAITGTSRADYNLGTITRGHDGDPALPDVTLTGAQSLPDWDGYSVLTTPANFFDNAIPVGSDGVADIAAVNLNNEGATLFLDDMALFANEIDLFRTGTDRAGGAFGDDTDPNYTDVFKHQNISTYTIGFGIENQMLGDAAVYGKGLNRQANNANSLADALSSFRDDVVGQIGSSASASATTAFLAGGNQLFQVKYNTSNWTGSLVSRTIDADPTSSTFGELQGERWNTDLTYLGSNSTGSTPVRSILTVNDETDLPVVFDWLNLSDNQRANLFNDQTVLNYLKGDQSLEESNGGGFRNRVSLLGDIVHSQPVYVGQQDYGYSDADYQTFLSSTLVQNRTPVVYVGSNDGFLHGFDASDNAGQYGTEIFAYAPLTTYPLLNALSEPAYSHHYSVDGRSTLLDAQLQSGSTQSWATVLISSMGAGGTGMFALDVTDPSRYTTSNFASSADDIYLWEINDVYPRQTSSFTSSASNLAPAGTATQSSTGFGGVAERAIDGNSDGIYNNDSVTHTNFAANEYWEIELAELSELDEVRLFNRTDLCCTDRLSEFSVFTSVDPFTSGNLATTQSQSGVTEFQFPGIAGSQETINLNGISARYLRVQLRGPNEALSLAEVEIMGRTAEGEFKDLGRAIDRPSIVRVHTNNTGADIDWYALTGNGVHSTDGNAVFYVIDLTTGEKIQEVVLDDTGNNGIISNTAVDIDGDDSVDRVYLTDIKGNIWRLNWEVTATSGQFESEYVDSSGDPIPFFEATETGDSSPQVVQAAIEVTRLPGESGTLFLHFGSGKYYDVEDSEVMVGDQQQSFYGVVDRGSPATGTYTPLTKSVLEPQTILTASITGANGGTVRAVDGDPVDFGSQAGWYIDLPTDGERIVYDPVAIKDRILFTTLIPEPTGGIVDPCVPVVTGWLMEVDALNGVSPETVAFDANGDGSFDSSDTTALTSTSPGGGNLETAGIQPTAGAPLPPSLIRVDAGAPSQGVIKGIVIDSAANVEEFIHLTPISRTSWRRLN